MHQRGKSHRPAQSRRSHPSGLPLHADRSARSMAEVHAVWRALSNGMKVAIVVMAILLLQLADFGGTDETERLERVSGASLSGMPDDAFYPASAEFNQQDAQRLLAAIQLGEGLPVAPGQATHPAELRISTDSGQAETWTLIPDPEAGHVAAMDEAGRCWRVPVAEAARLLSMPFFDRHYNDFEPSEMTCRVEDNMVAVNPVSATWTYPLPVGERTVSWSAEQDAEQNATQWIMLEKDNLPRFDFEFVPTGMHISFRLADGTLTEPFPVDGKAGGHVNDEWPLPEAGQVTMIVTVEQAASSAGESHGTLRYELAAQVPAEQAVLVSAETAAQGDFLGVAVVNPEEGRTLFVQASWLSKPIRLKPWNGLMAALVEIPVSQEPGQFTLQLLSSPSEDAAQAALMEDGEILFVITEKAFQKSVFSVSTELQEKRSDENLAKDSEKVKKARASSNPEPLWDGTFDWPITGEFGTGYGAQRLINGAISYRHSGIDISAPRGTPVLAPNAGRVVLAEELIVSGNTVILDHGLGLFTSYLHMDRLSVEVGNEVVRGTELGVVGSTGFSTGPHLHWTATLHGYFVDAHVLVEGDPLGMTR